MMRLSVLLLSLLLILPGCSYFRVGAEAVKDTLPRGKDVGTFKVGNPYQVQGQWYYPQETYSYDETGIASWYGPGFHGKRTANGEQYSQRELTAAHRTLQMPSFVRVTNLDNGKSVVVRVNDRGPFARGRVMDVSEKAAELLDFKGKGTARIRVQLLPEASRQVAQAAKEGRAWHGDMPNEQVSMASAAASPPTVRPYELNGQPIPAHQLNGEYYPDPVVTPRSVPASTSIYIQAGSFSQQANAERLAAQLAKFGHASVTPVDVKGVTYHRVRLGPIASVPEADKLLSRIGQTAPEAKTIVD